MSSLNTDNQSSEKSNPEQAHLNYIELVSFLCNPFLDSPDSLRIDCETSQKTKRVLIRLAIEGEDKGRVFGRGGRNLQAIRTVVQAIASLNGQIANIEVFGSSQTHTGRHQRSSGQAEQSSQRRRKPSRPSHRNKDI